MGFEDRNFTKIIKEICREEKIKVKGYGYDWVLKLSKGNENHYIYGHLFDLNSDSISAICSDKVATSDLLTSFNIANVKHELFVSPLMNGSQSNWNRLLYLLKKYKTIVCKPNDSSGGKLVYRVNNIVDLERAVHKIFSKERCMAVCPYYDIDNEYRTIVLDGKIELIYSKQRVELIGDGISSIRELILKQNKKVNNYEEIDLDKVLLKDEIYYLNWKHNLKAGSQASIEIDSNTKKQLETLVYQVVDKLNIKFASIDIICSNNKYLVLEINSGVMMEHFSIQDDKTYQIAKNIYKEAILKLFNH